MMDYPRISLSELHLGKFPDSMDFKAGKSTSELSFCLRTADSQITMLWINEVEIAKSIGELMTSRSITGHDVPDFDMLYAMTASALKKASQADTFPKWSKCRRAACSKKHDRFSRGRQIACMICEYFLAAGAYEAPQGLSTLFAIFFLKLPERRCSRFRRQMGSCFIICE